MAGRPRLKLLAALVAAWHLLALDWFAAELDYGSVLRPTATPMFTRLIEPRAPPVAPAPAAPAPRPKRSKPKPQEGSMAVALPEPQPEPSVPESTSSTVAEAGPLPPSPAEGMGGGTAATDPDAAASQPAAAVAPSQAPTDSTPPGPALDSWPSDTRVSYRLAGQFREGELYGDARVQWQREGSNYQVRLDVDITPWVTMAMTSQGEVTGQGLVPWVYEEERRGKRRAARFGERTVLMEGGRSALKPEGVQDTASQFVELAHRFATGREVLEVGRTVSFWMARPGAVDYWTYDIVARETLQTPQLGPVEAFHLKPRPIANPRGNVTAEMWFAPSLQYLPVRIKVSMGEQNYVDLLVEKIEQR